MPHKYHADRRHHIPKVQYRVRNWREHEAGLRRRGSLTIWVTEDAVEAWRAATRTTPGGQARYSDLENNIHRSEGRCAMQNAFSGISIAALAASALAICTSNAVAAVASVDASAIPRIGVTDPRYQSFNVEMLEVTGGSFWKPYKDI